MRLHLVTSPAVEPVSLAEVKLHRRIDDAAEDDLLVELIAAARQLFEDETGRQVVTATWRLDLDGFPCGKLEIPKAPLLAVSSVAYLDPDGASQTWPASEYTVEAPAGPFCRPGFLYPKVGYEYPSVQSAPNAVSVTFTAGYGATAALVPAAVKSTIKTLIGDLYEEREGFIAGTIVTGNPALARALNRFRVPVFA